MTLLMTTFVACVVKLFKVKTPAGGHDWVTSAAAQEVQARPEGLRAPALAIRLAAIGSGIGDF
jgi:hypothetical protein